MIKKLSNNLQNDTFPVKYYPLYHAAAKPGPTDPWINDPEGAVWDDKAQLFRAWAIYALDYNKNIFISDWLEFTSTDGVLWEPGVVRLSVNAPGYNGGGLWGGSVIIDERNTAGFGAGATIYLVTSAMNNPNPPLPAQCVSRWVAPQGLGVNPKFIDYVLKNPDNSSIDAGKDFRDPRVFWDSKENAWILCISVSYGIQFYKSENTKDWEFLSYWLAPGNTYGQPGGIECPNLFQMTADNGTKKWVLFYSDQNPPRETVRCVFGEWDGTNFIQDQNSKPFDLDYGWDFYAQSVYQVEDQLITLGWLGNWKYALGNPGTPFEGFKNYLIMPRRLNLKYSQSAGYTIQSLPVCDESDLFGKSSINYRGSLIGNGNPNIEVTNGNVVAFKVTLQLSVVNGTWPSNINLNVRANADAYTQLFLLERQGVAEVYRGKSGLVPSEGIEEWNSPAVAPVDFSSGTVTLEAYVDSASVEYFLQDGNVLITTQCFPLPDAWDVTLTASDDGMCRVDILSISPMNKTSS